MSQGLNNDVHTLTGAYVLDALSEVERRAFEEHMAYCAACTQEVAELHETTARLALAAAAVPPPDLWNRVRTATTQVRQLPPVMPVDRRTTQARRWPLRVAVGVAAASLIAAAGLGVAWITSTQDFHDQLAQSQNDLRQLENVLGAADAKITSGTVGNESVTAVASHSHNQMVVLLHDLPTLPNGRVYQAWFVKDEKTAPISAGTFTPATTSMSAELSAAQGAGTMAFTVEPTGGSTKPTLPTIGTVQIPA